MTVPGQEGQSAALQREQAAEWFVNLQGGDGADLPADELRRWEQWIAKPGNQVAFERIAAVWTEAGALQRPALSAGMEAGSDRRGRRSWMMAAALTAVAMGLGSGGAYWLTSRMADRNAVHVTGRGEHREVSLTDGSAVLLGASSRLIVRYSAAGRVVELERGEALFNVARDVSRPFEVAAGGTTVTALGTAFNVLHSGERTVVTVTEGRVEVNSGGPQPPAQLASGEQLSCDAAGHAGAIVSVDPAVAAGWRDGRRHYRRETLRRVVEDVNRYSSRHITVDPAVADLELTGVLMYGQIPQWTEGLQRIFPVEIVAAGDNSLMIRPRQPAGH